MARIKIEIPFKLNIELEHLDMTITELMLEFYKLPLAKQMEEMAKSPVRLDVNLSGKAILNS